MNTAEQGPAQVLADRIVKRLVNEGLLADDRFPRFAASLADGKLKGSDWRMAVESPGQVEAKPKRN